ncbi:MAG: hypothetical protein RIT03_1314 [Bacteroidota bacterium]
MKNIVFKSSLVILVLFLASCSASKDNNLDTSLNVPGPNVTDVDGHVYQSITSCGLTWTKTNLDVSKYSDGTPIPQVTNPTQWANLTTGAWCYYNNDPATGAIYGKLYNWYAAAGIYDAASLANPALRKNLAPTGWHVPVIYEWIIFTDCLGGYEIAGGKMKETGNAHWNFNNLDATNTSGFSGLPGGMRNGSGQNITTGSFQDIGIFGYWWGSTDEDPTSAEYFNLNYDNSNADRNYEKKTIGYSVRCVKD